MASVSDDNDIEESVRDAVLNEKVQSRDLKSERLLGKGSSSIVYETTWNRESYARKDFLRVPSDIFEREAAVLVGLDGHRNIVRTYCWAVNDGSCSLVVELMDGDLLNLMRKRNAAQRRQVPGSGPGDGPSQTSYLIDLHKFIEDGKNAPTGVAASESVASTFVYRFSMSEALQIMLQIAEGIAFLHDHGVAHGDLKPKNILVTPSEEDISGSSDKNVPFNLKVADFGLIGTKTKSKTLVSRQARRLEIVRWRAPELLDMSPLRQGDHESFSDSSEWDSDSSDGIFGGRVHKFSYGKLARGDVYSFALTCSQVLTGEDPYPGLGVTELARRISLGLRPGLPRRCPPQLSDLINRCWGEELKRPTFIAILSELKDLQASLTAGSWLDIKKTSNSGPLTEITISLKFPTEKFTRNRFLENLQGGAILSEKADLPIRPVKLSIKDREESSKLTFVPKKRRRRKIRGCLGSLGCISADSMNKKENEAIPIPVKHSAKHAVQNKKSSFGKAAPEPFPRYDKRHNAETGRTIGAKSYTPAEVTAITRNFKTEIGKGGFGTVYYGKLPDGQKVAVKVRGASSFQGERDFVNEIDVLSRVRHKNLVALVGYCQKNKHQMVIYEYMDNGSLSDHLFGNKQHARTLDWKSRLRIADNVAQGLEYLHMGCEQTVVHGDMKSRIILLSTGYDVKLTGFGLCKQIDNSITHVSTMVRGTLGYLDPEYYFTSRLTTKSDIYSFGVVLLELITGRPPIKTADSSAGLFNLCDWVRTALQGGNIDMVVDSALKSSVPAPKKEALWKVADIAMRCVEPKSVHRPTISEVVHELREAMQLEGPLEKPTLLVSSSAAEVVSLEFSGSDSYMWDSPLTHGAEEASVLERRRRRKAFSCLERLGCIQVKATSMGNEKEGISTSTSIPPHRSSWQRRRAEKSRADHVQKIVEYVAAESFTLAEVADMTRNFKTKIGRGGFGTVYYGILPDGQEVAVKVGEASSSQGNREFVNEINVLSRVRHKNLVALLGYCEKKTHQILIYEFMNNGSLRDHLSGNLQNAGILDWRMRLGIALEIAQVVEYLHIGCHPHVVHRDMKSSNILLSTKYNAKLTDFGLTKLMGERDNSLSEVSTQVMGTAGYLDPEYFLTSRLTTKSDIYSFGVVLLELITGRPPIKTADSSAGLFNLCDWVRTALQGGNIDMVVDPALKSSVPAPKKEALWKLAEAAMRCVEPKSVHRPTISEVVHELREAIHVERHSEDADDFEIQFKMSPEMV